MKKENVDTWTLICDTCNYEWTAIYETYGDVDWKCPKCESEENVSMLKYEPGDPKFYERELNLGKGGALHAR